MPLFHHPINMAQSPQEAWQKLQRTLQSARQSGAGRFPSGGGNPRNQIFGLGSIILLVGGGFVVNNALFNGKPNSIHAVWDTILSEAGC